ncbi:MAG: hypothetical protein ACRD0U_06825 [Acidimicrobiales bacterium]
MHTTPIAWHVIDGDVLLPAAYAHWLSASLGVLVAAIHHPHQLADRMPDTDPVAGAREVLGQLPELQRAALAAETQRPDLDPTEDSGWRPAPVITVEGSQVRISPGDELGSASFLLEVFATAVLAPRSPEAQLACGPLAYAATALTRSLVPTAPPLDARYSDRGHAGRRGGAWPVARHDQPPGPVSRRPTSLQPSACDGCTQGVMDLDRHDADGQLIAWGNDHIYGRCPCPCHPPPERSGAAIVEPNPTRPAPDQNAGHPPVEGPGPPSAAIGR